MTATDSAQWNVSTEQGTSNATEPLAKTQRTRFGKRLGCHAYGCWMTAVVATVLAGTMWFCCFRGMNAHERIESVFEVRGTHPFPSHQVRDAVLRKVPLGQHERKIAEFLSKNGIPNAGAGSRFLLSKQAQAIGMETNVLFCFVRTDHFKRQFLPSRLYQYLIYFRLDDSGSVTNVEVAGLEWCI